MEFKYRFFNELTVRELYEIVRARTQIFLLEQNIICQDFDGVDYESLHCFLEDGETVVAYLRAYRSEDGAAKIGRVLSRTHGIGLGTRLMRESMPVICEKFGCERLELDAQKQAEIFYHRLGFKTVSDEFLEEGIPHVKMALDNAGI